MIQMYVSTLMYFFYIHFNPAFVFFCITAHTHTIVVVVGSKGMSRREEIIKKLRNNAKRRREQLGCVYFYCI